MNFEPKYLWDSHNLAVPSYQEGGHYARMVFRQTACRGDRLDCYRLEVATIARANSSMSMSRVRQTSTARRSRSVTRTGWMFLGRGAD